MVLETELGYERESHSLTNLRKLGNVTITNCSYNRLQQEEKVWSG